MTACERFDAWLDAGMPAGDAAEVHASGCPRCTRALDAARTLDVLMAAPPPAAPPALTDAVMRAIAHERALRIAAAGAPRELLPWWVRMAAEPRVVGAIAIAALVVWRGPAVWAWASAATLAAMSRDWASALVPVDPRLLYGLYVWIGAAMTWGALAWVRGVGTMRAARRR